MLNGHNKMSNLGPPAENERGSKIWKKIYSHTHLIRHLYVNNKPLVIIGIAIQKIKLPL